MRKISPVLRVMLPTDAADYRIGVNLFLRGLACVYLVALVSWWVQAMDLVGSEGLVPMAGYLEAVEQHYSVAGRNSWWQLPTLFWINSSDAFVHCALGAGVVLALLVIFRIAQGLCFLGLWMIYLSLLHTGSVFMSFQWDILLVETGFVAVIAAPWGIWKKEKSALPSRVAIVLLWWLLFRLMFFSGWVKLAWPDTSWWGDFDAMTFHYETQPLPNGLAWWMHQLPGWFQKLSLIPMYMAELLLPFLIFCGVRLRLFAALAMMGLMAAIAATGNYTFFNLLTALLCLPLIADRYWAKLSVMARRFRRSSNGVGDGENVAIAPLTAPQRKFAHAWRWSLAAILLLLAVISIDDQLNAAGATRVRTSGSVLPAFLHRFHDSLRPLALVNGYGLFRTMTKERPEVVLEGTRDGGQTWREYDLKWKPGSQLDARPRQVAPHQPRLDWQFWFLALEVRAGRISPGNGQWLQSLMDGVLEGDDAAMRFFQSDPFEGQLPDAVRARLFLYEFTDLEEKSSNGNWWRRQPVGVFFARERSQLE